SSAPAEALLRFRGVAKIFPARKGQAAVTALSDIDLEVPRGAVVGVIGRSGAGKSTLIRLANGLERASAGSVEIAGRDVTALTERGWRDARRSIGMIFQHFNLLSSRSVFDNVALPLEVAGLGRAAIERRVAPLLDLVGLTDKRDRYPVELSGGQKQRVGIARALATEPELLLCDEATSALDPETTASILALLRRVNRELGVTILLITHEIPVIKEVCDRVAVIDQGRIVEQGATFEVFTRPAQATTARFVEAVTRAELSPQLAARLAASGGAGARLVLRIGFSGSAGTAPLVVRLAERFGSAFEVSGGRIDTVGGRPFGSLIALVPADGDLGDLVEEFDLTLEVLGHVA
ncbi:MAG: ATP-binding cassette domain-containing protein, partial [Tistlia sp.]